LGAVAFDAVGDVGPDPGAADVERKRWNPTGDLIDSRRARDEFTTPPLSRHQLFRRLKQTEARK
jgi:hypothetical protein